MRLDGEDACVQDAPLVADVVAHNVLARFQHALEQIGEGDLNVERAAFHLRRLAAIHGEQARKVLIALDDLEVFIDDDDRGGIFCSSALAFFCASLRV